MPRLRRRAPFPARTASARRPSVARCSERTCSPAASTTSTIIAAQKARTLITEDYARAYEQVDVILMPAAPRTAFKHGEISDPTQMYLSDMYTISINIAGNGGMTVPLGVGEESGLPVAAQLVAPAFKDERLITFGSALERAVAATPGAWGAGVAVRSAVADSGRPVRPHSLGREVSSHEGTQRGSEGLGGRNRS